jgi:hypothetical protein
MAVVTTISNHFKYMMMTKKVDMENDVFKMILLNTSFAFDKDAHATLADVTADQLATNYGYTQNNKTLSGAAVVESDALDKATCTWADVTWAASGGSIGPSGAAIIYDDTTTDDTVVCCIDFGADFTTPDGFSFQVQAPEVDLG